MFEDIKEVELYRYISRENSNAKLNLDFYSSIMSENSAKLLYDTIEKEVTWSTEVTTYRRSNQTFGDDGLVYTIIFTNRGEKKIVKRKVFAWDKLSFLSQVKNEVEKITCNKYNFCVIQRYPPNVGINPHRDKEMVPGTTICGLSLGSTRTLFMRYKNSQAEIALHPGSLYVLKPPTNDHWTHCISKYNLDETDRPRISLTFRNVPIEP